MIEKLLMQSSDSILMDQEMKHLKLRDDLEEVEMECMVLMLMPFPSNLMARYL